MTTTNHQAMQLARTDMQLVFEPNSFQEAVHLANVYWQSGLVPSAIKTPEAVVIIIMTGRELGFTAMQSLRVIDVISNRPCIRAMGKVALAKRLPECEYFNLIESTDTIATYETKRKGEKPTRFSFTWEDAVKSGKVSSNPNYKSQPKNMLRARASSALVDIVYPDSIMGLLAREELEDEDPILEKRSATFLEGEIIARPAMTSQSSSSPISTEPLAPTPCVASALDGILEAINTATSPDALKAVSAEIKRAIDAGAVSNVERLTAQGAYTEKMGKLKKAISKSEPKQEPAREPEPQRTAEIDPSEQPDAEPPANIETAAFGNE